MLRPTALPCLFAVLVLGLTQARAATVIWDGGGADNNWSSGPNWNGDTAPVTASPYDDVSFAGTVRPTVNVDSNVTAQTLKFVAGAAAFSIGGTGTINLTGTGAGHDNGLHLRNESSVLQTINNNINFTGTSIGVSAVNAGMTFNGNIDMTAATNIRFLGSPGRVTTLNGVLSGSGAGQLAFNSGGTFVLNNVNTFTKSVSIWSATVKVLTDAPNGANGAFGNSTAAINMGTTYDGTALTATLLASNAVTIGRNITLASSSTVTGINHNYTIGGDTAHISNYTGTITTTNGSGTKAASKLTVTAAAGGRSNIANIVRGSAVDGDTDDVVKIGAGIVAITGANNNWQGNTLIQNGAFLVNGTVLTNAGGKNAQISAGATLGGSGNFRRNVVLISNAILSPGDMNAAGTSLGGTLTVGDIGLGLSLTSSSILNFDLATASSLLDDSVSVLGSLVLAGQLNVYDLGGFGVGEYKLFDWTGSLTYNPTDLTFGNLPAGYSYTIDTTTHANSAYLIVTPEPGRMILLAIGLAALFARRRR